jgi:hypothetical protein
MPSLHRDQQKGGAVRIDKLETGGEWLEIPCEECQANARGVLWIGVMVTYLCCRCLQKVEKLIRETL